MALLTVGGQRVTTATITMPARGVWRCVASIDGTAPSGQVTIACGSVSLIGTVKRATTHAERVEVEVVGGKSTWQDVVTAQEFASPTLGLVVKDTLGTESLSSTSPSAYQSKSIPRWVRLASSRSAAMDALVKANGGTWRVLDDGTVWIGEETWPDGVTVDYLESDTNERLTFAQSTPTARPGTKVSGKQITSVTFTFSASSFRTVCEYGNVDLGDNLAKLIKASAPLDWFALYPCKIVKVGWTAVDVKPDRDDLPAMADVPIRIGTLGEQAKCTVGCKALLGFEQGNPQSPYVALWSSDGTADEIKMTTSTKITQTSPSIKIDGGTVDVGVSASGFAGDVQALITAINALVTSINANVIAYNACVPVPLTPLGTSSPMVPLVPVLPTGIVSTKVKVAI